MPVFSGDSSPVPNLAPRIRKELLEAIVRHDKRTHPIAETCRRVGREAERRGLTRPSYERVRELVHESRRIRRGPTTASVLVDVALRARPPEAVLDVLAGEVIPEIRR
jgi:proteasome lid subunit RPN8/RPN11